MFITGFHSIEEKVRSQKKNQAAAGSGKAEGSAAGSAYKIYFSKPGPRVKKILAAAKEALGNRLDGKTIIKEIYVPNKIINIVAK